MVRPVIADPREDHHQGAQIGSFRIGKRGLDAKAALFWLLVGIPLAWGIWNTVEKTLVLLQ